MWQLYGLANCDSVRKAKKWLTDHGIETQWNDLKTQPPSIVLIQHWVSLVGVETLLNKKSTSYRQLATGQKSITDSPGLVLLMHQNPLLIKRPVLVKGDQILVGFDALKYSQTFC